MDRVLCKILSNPHLLTRWVLCPNRTGVVDNPIGSNRLIFGLLSLSTPSSTLSSLFRT